MSNWDFINNYGDLRNWGKLDSADIKIEGAGTQCGDVINLYIKLENGIIKDAKFDGDACILSTISADIFLSKIIGMNIKEAVKISENSYLEEFPINVSPGRIGCVLLPLRTLKRSEYGKYC